MDASVSPAPLAAGADLTYVHDTDPGIRRRRAGGGFYFVGPGGERLNDPDALSRIRSLAIPPAWTDVWISPDPNGHIQATGRDARGRKQYRYHPGWMTCRDEAKFSSLVPFAESLPRLRDRIDGDLRRRGLPRERVIASVVWLLDRTLIRVGNEIYTRQNKSFGLTTLRERHVEVEGAQMRFSFIGKSGKEWRLKLTDRRIAGIVQRIEELPGQHLFKYLDEDGGSRAVHSQDVNLYIQEAIGTGFSSKHFRTWGATTHAAMLLAYTERPDAKAAQKHVLNELVDAVAAKLNNTRTVCRRCYIHPQVISAWEEGSLAGEVAELRRRFRRPLKGLADDESITLRWLRGRAS